MSKAAKPAELVTKDMLRDMIVDRPHARVQHVIGRALVAIFNRQTASEKESDSTDRTNGVGFSGLDSIGGSLTAKSYMSRGSLLPWQVEKWTRLMTNGYPRICKYSKQLNEIAVAKAAWFDSIGMQPDSPIANEPVQQTLLSN